ncbi:GlxA family transcriptional regulator [Parvularcula dongshanensis]|uniref:Transcriptional regulator GlxA family with amidase domain n=1 Tax=Parvularcula dongshanensis TaxID=1173995 RepID=A0A840I4N0_9PROT|nr:GlxA family transcriptional regulator [Parvularcula dongshanensis]MBB4659312.1 transcriptional regulator GlxA family with amidase domain [Parvularcula dongshanensis]
MPSVGFYLCAGHQLLDLSGPLCAFQTARAAGGPAYDLVLVSADGGSLTGSAGVAVETVRAAGRSFDTLIVVGGDVDALQAAREVAAIGPLARSARRLASVCTGAFLLARAGLLDGRRATTHWLYARRLSEAYPKVRVTPDAIFVEDGGVWTSAGITAGIDLALALIEADAGASLAREVARYLVVYHHRAGGQSQFSALSAMAPETDRIRRVLTYARENLRESLSVERLAAEACLSERQFARLFRKETGETPAKAVERLRVEAARRRLEDSAAPIEAIAREVGFYDPERMRRAFLRLYGQPPQALRRRSA